MAEDALYVECGKFITDANRQVLSKRLDLKADDARQYIETMVEADRVLTRSITPQLVESAQESVAYGEQALREWSTDRSRGFLWLLQSVDQSAHARRFITAETGALTSAALIEEAIIPSNNPEIYLRKVARADNMRASTAARQSPNQLLYTTYFLGIYYNAEAFAPILFQQEVTPALLKKDKETFLGLLGSLKSQRRD